MASSLLDVTFMTGLCDANDVSFDDVGKILQRLVNGVGRSVLDEGVVARLLRVWIAEHTNRRDLSEAREKLDQVIFGDGLHNLRPGGHKQRFRLEAAIRAPFDGDCNSHAVDHVPLVQQAQVLGRDDDVSKAFGFRGPVDGGNVRVQNRPVFGEI